MSKNFKKGKIVACLDMGSSKLICIIASIIDDEIKILGYGHKESKGIMAGAISDMRLAEKSIINVISEAERMAGFNIDKVLVGISGSQIQSNRKEVSAVITTDIVKSSDIKNLADLIRYEFNKANREIIHLIPIQYRIDDSDPIENPRYMSGDRLFAKFFCASTSQTTIKNIQNCLKRCQLSVDNYVSEPFASALSCLSDNDMNLGSIVIDIGGSSTSFCIIVEGKIIHIGSSLVGGMHINKDIATILGVKYEIAEKIKNINSSLLISPIEEKEIIKFDKSIDEDLSSIRITRSQMRDIISSRLEEIFESIKVVLEKSSISISIVPNIVITGGVTSIVGIDKLASEIFNKNVKIGYPIKSNYIPPEILNTANSCSLGMLIFLRNLYQKERNKTGFETKNNWFKKIIEKIASL